MSVNINIKQITDNSKWETVNSGDFVILEGTPEHPIPHGLYRVFIISDSDSPLNKNIFIVPMFDGPFEGKMFPYVISNVPFPKIIHIVNHVNIEVKIN